MNLLKTMAFSIAALCAVTLGGPAAATTILTYEGNGLTLRNGPHVFGDEIVASIELAGPLGANFSGAVTPLSMTMAVGGEVISTPFSFRAFFSTNGAGDIAAWNVAAFSNAAGTLRFSTINSQYGQFGQVGGVVDTALHFTGGVSEGYSFATSQHAPGVWTVTTRANPSAVPEPAAWALMIIGVGLVGGRLRRRQTAVVV